jgi:hypothetical protein
MEQPIDKNIEKIKNVIGNDKNKIIPKKNETVVKKDLKKSFGTDYKNNPFSKEIAFVFI